MADELVGSWERHLRARNKAASTIVAYIADVTRFEEWLAARRSPTSLVAADHHEVEQWFAEGLAAGLAAATVSRRYRSLLQFYGWLEREDEITANPMQKVGAPAVPVQPPPVIRDEETRSLLRAAGLGQKNVSFEGKRDQALLLLLATTGIRAGELMGLRVADVDLNAGVFSVIGKGRRARLVVILTTSPFGSPSEALDRYMRARKKHPHVASSALWLGAKGALTQSGLTQMLERRCKDAGIPAINPHRFRHTFAHMAKMRGMTDDDLMAVAGWRSAQMLQRYGASAQAERGRAAHRRLFEEES